MSSDEVDKDVEETGESDVKQNGVKEEEVVSKPAGKKKGTNAPKIKQPAKKRGKTEQVENKKKEAKKDEKKVEPDESEEENEEEEDKAVPLLDQPLEITGSRKRKEIQRFTPISRDEAESKEVRIPEGKGKPLGDIPWVEAQIQRAKPEDLKLLHRICFGKPGKAILVKKTLKKFNGFEFEEASDEYEKKKVAVENGFKKVTVNHLKNICNLLNIEKGGQKSEIIDRILSYLTKPVDSGKNFPGSGRSKRPGAASKNYDEGEEKFDSKKKGKGKKKEEVTSDPESEDEVKSSEEKNDSENDVKDNEEKKEDSQTTEESEEESPVKKVVAKKGAKKGKKAATAEKKAPPKKRAASKKTESDKEEASAESEGDDDAEPLAKKAKAPPTDDEIKTYVKSLLDGANLEQITMKKVCQQVYEHYPDFDLGQKKDFIKTTVKSLISS